MPYFADQFSRGQPADRVLAAVGVYAR